MANFIDLEDENLINEDENELYMEGEEINDIDSGENITQVHSENTNEDSSVKISAKKRVIRKPQPKLNYERLSSSRGLLIMEKWFEDIKFKGKGHEKEDLDLVMNRMQQWCHRLFPKYTFDDTLKKIETLGHKTQVMNYVKRIRLGMEEYNLSDRNRDDDQNKEKDKAIEDSLFDNLVNDVSQNVHIEAEQNTLTAEQRERIVRNRLLAEERRLMRKKARDEELALRMTDEEPF